MPLEWGQPNVKRTHCSMCPGFCPMLVEVKDGKAVSVYPDKNNRLGTGRFCIKGPRAIEYHDHPLRLNYPQKRAGARGENKWERITWDQALDEIAAKLAELRDIEGPEMLATMGGTHQGCGDWSNFRFSVRFGTPNFIIQGRNCGVGEFSNEVAMYGWDTKISAPMPGLTKCSVIWGTGLEGAGQVSTLVYKKTKQAGGKLIVVDPRTTAITKIADLHLQIKPRTDGALILGWIHVMIKEGLYDKEFVDKWCLGFDEVRKSVEEWTPERASEICGVPAEDIVKAARMYGQNRPAKITTGVALIQQGQGASQSSVRALHTLKAISGNLDVVGGEPQWGPYDPNTFAWLENIRFDKILDHPLRTRDSVNADYTPICSVRGYAASREAMAKVYPDGFTGCEYQLFADPSAVYRAILEKKPYPIRALIMQGGNPLQTMGGGKKAAEAFKSPNLDLLVCVDHWMTPSALLADYVLPATDFLERPDIASRLGLMPAFTCGQQSLPSLFERRHDYDFWAGLARRLAVLTEFEDAADWPDTLEEMYDRFLAPSGKTFHEWADGPMNWSMKMPEFKKYEKQGFATASGKVELIPGLYEKLGMSLPLTYEGPPFCLPDVDDEDSYPLQMIPGTRFEYATASRQFAIKSLMKNHPDPICELHPETAASYGIAEGDWVLIDRPEGTIRQKVKLNAGLRRDIVHPEGYWWDPYAERAEPSLSGAWSANANSITPSQPELSSFAGDQLLRGMRCQIRKAG